MKEFQNSRQIFKSQSTPVNYMKKKYYANGSSVPSRMELEEILSGDEILHTHFRINNPSSVESSLKFRIGQNSPGFCIYKSFPSPIST